MQGRASAPFFNFESLFVSIHFNFVMTKEKRTSSVEPGLQPFVKPGGAEYALQLAWRGMLTLDKLARSLTCLVAHGYLTFNFVDSSAVQGFLRSLSKPTGSTGTSVQLPSLCKVKRALLDLANEQAAAI